MFLWDKVIDSVTGIFGKVADKIWMDKSEKEKLEFDKLAFVETMKMEFTKVVQDGTLKEMQQEFQEHQAQRDYANNQFGTVTALATMGFVGKVVLFGRASIRWVITGGFSLMAWRILESLLPAIQAKLAAGGALSWIEFLILAQILGVPLFYVCGVSIEKWLKVRQT